jgi:XTP/dITP diphosphohydrolase
MEPRRIVVATRNRHKLEEIRLLLEGLPVRLVTLDEAGVVGELAEEGKTFAENAASKAEQAAEASGLAALADDSGLEVEALEGRPGVRSARYAGPRATDAENNKKLVDEAGAAGLEGTPARFRCVAALALDGRTRTVEGTVEGTLLLEPRGRGGFGYDPHFLLPGLGKTMAELTREEKNRISHRAQAFGRMRAVLEPHLRQAEER